MSSSYTSFGCRSAWAHGRGLQRRLGLSSDIVQFRQRLIDGVALFQQLLAPLRSLAEQVPQLGFLRRVGVVEVQVFLDRAERKSQPLATQDQAHAGLVAY